MSIAACILLSSIASSSHQLLYSCTSFYLTLLIVVPVTLLPSFHLDRAMRAAPLATLLAPLRPPTRLLPRPPKEPTGRPLPTRLPRPPSRTRATGGGRDTPPSSRTQPRPTTPPRPGTSASSSSTCPDPFNPPIHRLVLLLPPLRSNLLPFVDSCHPWVVSISQERKELVSASPLHELYAPHA